MEVPAKGNVLGRFVPARYILGILGSIGMAIIYGLKVNLSVAMVGMINNTAIKSENNDSQKTYADECKPSDGGNSTALANHRNVYGHLQFSEGLLTCCRFREEMEYLGAGNRVREGGDGNGLPELHSLVERPHEPAWRPKGQVLSDLSKNLDLIYLDTKRLWKSMDNHLREPKLPVSELNVDGDAMEKPNTPQEPACRRRRVPRGRSARRARTPCLLGARIKARPIQSIPRD
ncbi:hypothetical protein EVAR_93290_1 [Eumeta japonica]|uniref:Uncharacterized protein n=1 Tax=Eumeta variegata TaxID=151549 RepID=A0A4C1USP3_EUMVA|nr:hypothetical protein EVAR_93290_1 [Eumeta japonica]